MSVCLKVQKIGLLGFGYWGINLARVISQNEFCRLCFICEPDLSKHDAIKKIYPNICVVKDYSEFNIDSIDAVVISTPTITHFEITRYFLKNSVHVFCEKPLSLYTHQISELEHLAIDNNLKLMVGHIFEFNAVVNAIKQIINSPNFGDVLYINMVRAGLGPIREDVNVVYDLVTHDISILNHILPSKPSEVFALGSCFINENIEDVVFINLVYENKIKVNIQASWLEAAKERSIKIVGTNKMLIFNDLDPVAKLKIYNTGASYQKFTGDFGVFQLSLKDGDIIIPNIDYKEPLLTEINHFVDCILNDKQPKTNAKNAFDVVTVLEKIQKSLGRL
jgi:predicted dehydrogenase